MLPKIIKSGTYRPSDREREWRLVQDKEGKLVIEFELDVDALGNIIWAKSKDCTIGSVGYAVLDSLIQATVYVRAI